MKKQNNPFTNLILDEEEKLIEESLKKGKFKKDKNFEETKAMLEKAANIKLSL